MIEEALAGLVERFNRHADHNPGVRAELVGISRTIAIRLTDERQYAVDLKEGRLSGLRSGAADKADLTIVTDSVTFLGLLRREIGPMRALATRKLSITGSIEDKLLLRRLLA
ncbi:MAG: SCP2 sterol-binding domain-containing protein [Thermoplasmata archaeon]|nr:SCP2 sterol-binding domain-containing protein [Thermoplasmata archaeon]MCI4341767.1 SCP2 sterol-binding domain-containing protein [Thermoplasmata archaeon]